MKNPCEARKIKASHNLHKIISTHLLTVLIIRDIVQIEQRKGNKEIRNVPPDLFGVQHSERDADIDSSDECGRRYDLC